jgi:ribosomal protein S18 acetylase RimI-like enzyme
VEGLHSQVGRMGLIVRPLQASDREAVARMLDDCAVFSQEEVRVALAMVDSGDYTFFAVELDGAVRGYACIGRTPLTLATWHLYWICIHPGAQRRGAGMALQQHVEEFIRSQKGERLVLETSGRADYERTRRFYERAGYQQAGRIPGYYKAGDDCVFYFKEL